MTTIACDGKTLASDSRSTFGTLPSKRGAQKVLVRDGCVYAMAGLFGILDVLAEWHASGADPAKLPPNTSDGWEICVVSRAGTLRYSSTAPYGVLVDRMWTLGSGRDYALGAMHAGASPAAAVKISAALDIYTGGPVQVVDLAKVFAKSRRGKRPSKRGRK